MPRLDTFRCDPEGLEHVVEDLLERRRIRARLSELTLAAIARRHGVSTGWIWYVLQQHVRAEPGEIPPEPPPGSKAARVLPDLLERDEVRAQLKLFCLDAIGRRYGASRQAALRWDRKLLDDENAPEQDPDARSEDQISTRA